MKNEILQEFTFYDYSDVSISFSIKTKVLDLQTLTELLRLNPTRGWTNGEKYMGKQLNTDTKKVETIERAKTWTMFVYETTGLVASKRFQEHADHLLSKLEPIKTSLEELLSKPEQFEIFIQVYLTIEKDEKYFGFATEPPTIKRLTDYCHLIEWRAKLE